MWQKQKPCNCKLIYVFLFSLNFRVYTKQIMKYNTHCNKWLISHITYIHILQCVLFWLSFNIVNAVEPTTRKHFLCAETFIQRLSYLVFVACVNRSLTNQRCYHTLGYLWWFTTETKSFYKHKHLDVIKYKKQWPEILLQSSPTTC